MKLIIFLEIARFFAVVVVIVALDDPPSVVVVLTETIPVEFESSNTGFNPKRVVCDVVVVLIDVVVKGIEEVIVVVVVLTDVVVKGIEVVVVDQGSVDAEALLTPKLFIYFLKPIRNVTTCAAKQIRRKITSGRSELAALRFSILFDFL
jgi:hypothetical protein